MDAAAIRKTFELGEFAQAHAHALALYAQQPSNYENGLLLLQTGICSERVDGVLGLIEDLAPRIPAQTLHLLSFQAHLCTGNYAAAWSHLHKTDIKENSVAFHDCAYRIAFKEYDLAKAIHHLIALESLRDCTLPHFFRKFEILKLQGKHTEIANQIQFLQRNIAPGEVHPHRLLRLWEAGVAHAESKFDKSLAITQKLIEELFQADLQQAAMTAVNLVAQPKKPWTRQKQHQVIHDVERLMLMHRMPLFMVAGSLLSLVREGDFFLSDKDMDFGVLGADFEPTVERLIQSRYFDDISPPNYFVGYKQLRHRTTGFAVDITHYKTQNNKIHATWGHVLGYVVRETVFNPFTLREAYFPNLRCRVLIPDNAEDYLCSLYGDWRTPDPYFNTVVAARNLCQLTPFLISLGFIGIGNALLNGLYRKAKAGAKHLQDGGFNSSLLNQIHGLL